MTGVQTCALPIFPGRILFVGRLEKMKGVDCLLRALKELVRSQKSEVRSATLRIVGDGSERRNLEKLSQELGLTDRVTFVGRLSGRAVFDEYAQAEIFCGLSRSEALGNVFLEAQAAGCAVVATRIGGIPEIVHDGETGILVPVDSLQSAADALTRVLTDSSLRAKLGTSAKKNAEQYDWEIVTKKYQSLLVG